MEKFVPSVRIDSNNANNPHTSLKKLALKLGTDGPVKVFPTSRMVKILYNGSYILQTTQARFVWEHPFYPQFYVPKAGLLESTKQGHLQIAEGETFQSSPNGPPLAQQLTLRVGDKSTDNVLAFSDHLSGPAAELRGLVKIDFASMDQWFEEDTPVFVHPKDPFKRVDILQSTRHVRVLVDGKVVADAHSSMHLYETGLPCRYYLPLTSVDASVLRPSRTRTRCPYKGEAEYYSIEVDGKLHEDVVWYYKSPTLESSMITGLVCFYNEKVDIELDGVKLEQPDTHFGKSKPGEDKKPSAI
ncbi:hypothetical protein M433DRAFT_2260 [Acidomyces richmondensis BFW]|nr:MAG: hypothetical protein FE78DRAFT_229660 [Acidomyces sp. 'richmondensis']KYG48156.1 hypothetical protein M433DRAFT_2260 [Acidomyces richmondensis BFW]